MKLSGHAAVIPVVNYLNFVIFVATSRKAQRLMAFACLWGATGQVSAQAIVSPVSATTDMGQAYALANAYNHSGLLTNFTSGVTDFNAYIAGNPQHNSQPNNDWAATTVIGVADFDLGSVRNVNRVAIWNFGGLAGSITYAIKQVSLESSIDSSFSSPTILGTYNLGVYSTTNPGQVFSFPTVTPGISAFITSKATEPPDSDWAR